MIALRRSLGAVALCAGMVLSGCARFAPFAEPPPEPEPVAVTETQPEPRELLPEPKPLPDPRAPEPLPSVAIVLTSSEPAYRDVANALVGELERFDLYTLSEEGQPPVTLLRSINDSDSSAVVAIGLRAAQSSVAMADTPVVFSQVFNHEQHELVTDSSRGIAALPPPRAQFAAWQQNNPDLRRIGTIIGAGHKALVEEAEQAAEELGIELRVGIAQSDQETLYLFRRMIRDIDGFWLLPDNRILSRRALEEMLADANRLRVPVAVPSEKMLAMGGTISLESVANDIAATILDVIRAIQADELATVPPISSLSEIRVTTRDVVQVADR